MVPPSADYQHTRETRVNTGIPNITKRILVIMTSLVITKVKGQDVPTVGRGV